MPIFVNSITCEEFSDEKELVDMGYYFSQNYSGINVSTGTSIGIDKSI